MKRSTLRLALPLVLTLSAGGCALVPPEPIVTGPLSAPPPPPPMPSPIPNGAIYQPTAYGSYPLFEDRRPRNVGDIITIVLNERTNAAKGVATSTSRQGGATLGVAALPSLAPSWLGRQGTDMTGTNDLNGQGASSANNTFTGTITTTVIGVLPNGNLQVAGEKQIAINRGSEYIRFAGTIDPRSISGASTVSSTQVADARVEYRSKGTMDEVQTMGWLQRFFLNISPF